MLPIIILFVVFILIAVRKIGNFKLQIWQIMLFGALAVLLTGQISPYNALVSINPDVMLFLFGMFIVGEALEESGYLSYLAYRLFNRAKTSDSLLMFILFGIGILSAFLMNDTLAIIGTPAVLLLAKNHRIHPKVLLLALAFAVTIGSVASPIGNPQNLLIAINSTIPNPFVTFFKFLFVPTVINLFMCYLLLKIFYKNQFHKNILSHSQEPIKNHKLAVISKISLILIVFLILAKIIFVFLDLQINFKLTYIALTAALPVILFSKERLRIIKKIDWYTLIFFAAMFVLMESVWQTGFFQSLVNSFHQNLTSIQSILSTSVILSQFISNVPLVALYLPILLHAGVSAKGLVALAAGSTIAGNLLILGAASNVIIIQNAEKKANTTITFLEFAKVGVPLTLVNILIYWLFLTII